MSDDRVLEGEGGSITISAGALEQVVRQAAESVDGARVPRPRRGLELEVDGDAARVELDLAARNGLVLTDLATLRPEEVDMLTVLIVGNSQTRLVAGRMVTPRGYRWRS